MGEGYEFKRAGAEYDLPVQTNSYASMPRMNSYSLGFRADAFDYQRI